VPGCCASGLFLTRVAAARDSDFYVAFGLDARERVGLAAVGVGLARVERRRHAAAVDANPERGGRRGFGVLQALDLEVATDGDGRVALSLLASGETRRDRAANQRGVATRGDGDVATRLDGRAGIGRASRARRRSRERSARKARR
jgi:hypothetical protein